MLMLGNKFDFVFTDDIIEIKPRDTHKDMIHLLDALISHVSDNDRIERDKLIVGLKMIKGELEDEERSFGKKNW